VALSHEELQKAIVETSQKFSLPYSESSIAENIEFYKPYFFQDTNYIQFRIAKKKDKILQLNWRSEIFKPNLDAKPIIEHVYKGINKFSPWGKQPTPGVCVLIEELSETFPTSGIAVDFDPFEGFTKLWHWGRYNIQQMSTLKNAPPSLKNYLDIFAQESVSAIYCCGVDYSKNSMNVYFSWREQKYKDSTDVKNFIQKVGFSLPPEEYLPSMAQAACLACTFRWDSPTMERCSFYMDRLAEIEVFEGFMKDCDLPTKRSSPPTLFVSCSVGKDPEGFYRKFEMDYFRSYRSYLVKIQTFIYKKD